MKQYTVGRYYLTETGETYDHLPLLYDTKEEAEAVLKRLQTDPNFLKGFYDKDSEDAGFLMVDEMEVET